MIAFGDGQNDASMLTYSGTAVAMANAVQELKDIADIITLLTTRTVSLKRYEITLPFD